LTKAHPLKPLELAQGAIEGAFEACFVGGRRSSAGDSETARRMGFDHQTLRLRLRFAPLLFIESRSAPSRIENSQLCPDVNVLFTG
jgi:hypothetical protein